MPLIAAPGATVIARDQRWRVARVEPHERCSVFTLEATGRPRVRLIDPFDRITTIDADRIVLRRRRAVVEVALTAAASARPATGLWTAARAAIDLMPYQLEPALAVLHGATRLLLADAVGLGKTIQAGLVLSELRERGLVERALVLCPAGLRHNWAHELRHRFGVSCAVFDQQSIAEASAALPHDVNPWATQSTVIASIDFVKRPEVIAALAEVPIDLVIADEAHHLTPGTERGDAVSSLAARAPWCVLVSATPHSGDDAAFTYLCGIGDHGEALTIFRRSRRDAGFTSSRRERIVRLRSSDDELALHGAVEAYTRAIWCGRAAVDPSVQLIAITIARRAASSPLALERTLRRRLALLTDPSADLHQTRLPWDEEDEADGPGVPSLLAKPGLDDERAEQDTIRHLLALISRSANAVKLRWIARVLQRVNEPAIVFTEYRDTLDALIAVLPPGIRAATICGTTPVDERRAAVDGFNSGRVDVLLATDTAGEGLNLHHRCRLVIDVEVPWNPLRLEQRLGRVDRLGQQRRVHALRLLHASTIEERVLDRLQLRRQRAEWLDHAAIDERSVAAGVFGAAHHEPARAPSIATARVNSALAEHSRLNETRRLAGHDLDHETAVGVSPKRRRTEVMVCVHRITYVNEAGSIVAVYPGAHIAVVNAVRFEKHKHALDAIRCSQRLQAALHEQRLLACDAIERDLAPFRESLAERLKKIRAHLAASRHKSFQPSLFDGRAGAAAAQRDRVFALLDHALQHRLDCINAAVEPRVAATQLVAVWPLHRR